VPEYRADYSLLAVVPAPAGAADEDRPDRRFAADPGPRYSSAILLALGVLASEFLGAGLDPRRFFGAGFPASSVSVALGGALLAAVSASLGPDR